MIDLYTAATPNGHKVSVHSRNSRCRTVHHLDLPALDRRPGSSRSTRAAVSGIVDRDETLRDLRIRRDPGVSRREEAPAADGRAVARDATADVPDGRHRTDDGSGGVFYRYFSSASISHRSLSGRGPPPANGARWATRGSRVSRWRLLDHRYRHLAVGARVPVVGRLDRRAQPSQALDGPARGARVRTRVNILP